MSSLIANSTPTTLQLLLVGFHQLSAHTNRIGKLSAAIGTCINEIFSRAEGPILSVFLRPSLQFIAVLEKA